MLSNTSITTGICISSLGLRPYCEVWELQKDLQQRLINGSGEETLILCEHPPVITIGRSGSSANILVSEAELARRGIELYEIERGGDVTYHGPGQLVAYPILDLNTKKRDVGWYMRALEEVIIKTLSHYSILGERYAGRTGVWTRSGTNDMHLRDLAASDKSPLRKIASIGVRISRWCTLHGLALNIRELDEGFQLINPCGYIDTRVTSIEQESGREVDMQELSQHFVTEFCKVFSY